MSSNEYTLVAVHPEGDRRNLAEVYASALQDVRRADVSDAVLHAYVTAADFIHGAMLAGVESGARIAVCVRRSFNTRTAYAALLDRVDRGAVSVRPSHIF